MVMSKEDTHGILGDLHRLGDMGADQIRSVVPSFDVELVRLPRRQRRGGLVESGIGQGGSRRVHEVPTDELDPRPGLRGADIVETGHPVTVRVRPVEDRDLEVDIRFIGRYRETSQVELNAVRLLVVQIVTSLLGRVYIVRFRVVGVAASNDVAWRDVSDWHTVRIVDNVNNCGQIDRHASWLCSCARRRRQQSRNQQSETHGQYSQSAHAHKTLAQVRPLRRCLQSPPHTDLITAVSGARNPPAKTLSCLSRTRNDHRTDGRVRCLGQRPSMPPEKLKPAGNASGVRDPQYVQPADDDGLWLDGPPKGSPEYKAFIGWLFE